MSRLGTLRFGLVMVIGFVAAVGVGRLATRFPGEGWDVAGLQIRNLKPESRTYLAELKEPLRLTFLTSSQKKIPSSLKLVKPEVLSFLRAVQKTNPEKIQFDWADPESDSTKDVEYAASKRVFPVRRRRVLQDEESEEEIWSSLIVAYGSAPEFLIQGITNETLPFLEDLLMKNLKAIETPPQVTFGVSVPKGFELFVGYLRTFGTVVELDLKDDDPIPPKVDVLFWLDPKAVSEARLADFQRFVESGGSVILGGSLYRTLYGYDRTASIAYQVKKMKSGMNTLLAPYGVRLNPDLLMDKNQAAIIWINRLGEIQDLVAPFHIRCFSSLYDFKRFFFPSVGSLNFVSASPLQIDPPQLRKAGFDSEIVATSSENSWTHPWPKGIFNDTIVKRSLPVGRQPLMLLLVPRHPLQGQILVMGTSSLFRTGVINQKGFGHAKLVNNLARTFSKKDFLVNRQIPRPEPERVPPLDTQSRWRWRAVVVGACPVLLLCLLLFRTRLWGSGFVVPRLYWVGLAQLGLALVLIYTASSFWLRRGAEWDWTDNKLNQPLPLTKDLLSPYKDGVTIDYISSGLGDRPFVLRQLEDRVRVRLSDLDLPFNLIRPEQLSPSERAALQKQGLKPFDVRVIQDDQKKKKKIWSGLRLSQGQKSVVIPRLELRNVDHLEFLLVTRLKELNGEPPPHIAFHSDLPRLSGAEAAFYFNQQGLSPPSGTDVYSEVQTLLKEYGYRVSYINPKNPTLPKKADALLWFQPRWNASVMLGLFADHLAKGGKALVAMQHYNIQQRQYRGRGFKTVYWPQTQQQDLNRYLFHLGLQQDKEILMDRTKADLKMETQVIGRGRGQDFETQPVALPFLIRAIGASFSPTSDLTARLSDQLFVWGNRFSWDPKKLEQQGLSAQVLISTTKKAWSFVWKGGWLPSDIFRPQQYLTGPQALAIRLTGTFPRARVNRVDPTPASVTLRPQSQNQGELLLVGSSAMFNNNHLFNPEFRHDQFLLNMVASLTHGAQLVPLQARQRSFRGFGYLSPETKLSWRLLILGGAPLFVFVFFVIIRHAQENPHH